MIFNISPGTGGSVETQLQVNIDTGSLVTVTDGVTELTDTAADGKCLFDIPNYGTWEISAELNGETTSETLFIDTAKLYVVDLAYFAATLTVAPAPESHTAYGEAGVYASAQGDGTLTFMCSDVPTADLTVNVLIAG